MRTAYAFAVILVVASFRLAEAQLAPSPILPRQPAGAFQGTLGVQSFDPTSAPISLTLIDAIQRGLQKNLAVVLEEQQARLHDGERWQALAGVLPNVSAGFLRSRQTANPAAFGFDVPVVGPFNVIDLRLFFSQPLLNLPAVYEAREGKARATASAHASKYARDLVVLAVAHLYFQVGVTEGQLAAAAARADSAEAALTASRDAGGDALPERARVQGEQQRVVALKATLMKQKLALAQALGLPRGQPFTLSDQMSYAPLRQMTLDDALGRAYRGRADFQAQLARVEAAEAKRRSASSERLPTVHIRADIGKIGQEPPSAKKTFGLQGILHVPIMGGATRGNVLEADAELRQEKAKLEDLRDAIYYQIQNALIDVQAAEEEVRLARGAVQLADEQLARSTDRGVVTAGAATTPRNVIDRAGAVEPRQGGDSGDTLQAQDAATAANANYISSLYTFNAAKLTFAQAIGVAEAAYMQFLAGTF